MSMQRRQRGLAVVELALIVPVFVMVLVATAEVGRALYQYNTLNKAVRDAAQFVARYGVIAGYIEKTKTDPSGSTTSTVETIAKNLAVYGKPAAVVGDTTLLPGMTVNDVTVTEVTAAGAGGPTYVTVSATYTFLKIFTVIPTFGFGSNITLPGTMTASVTMAGLGS
jgi:Flp pilus assembly protein TadG